jgi:hypothetical protein
MFDHLPIAKNAAQLAFVDEDTFFEALPAVYEAYVRGYYAKMLKEADGGGGQAGVGGTSNSKLSRPARRP